MASFENPTTENAANAAIEQEGKQLFNQFIEAISFVKPEILTLDPKAVEGFIASDPRLADYRPILEDILRRQPHTRSPEVEKVLAQALAMRGTPDAVYSMYTGADFPYPEVTLSTGETVTLDASGYSKYRSSPNREDRKKVFQAFWTAYDKYRRTFGSTMHGQVMTHVFVKDVRGYDSCLEASLDQNSIPVAVYKQLIADVHKNLPTLHRYLKLKQRMLGLDGLRYDDLYASAVEEVEMSFTPDEAMALTLKAFAPLGDEYVSTMKKGYESRWTDWYPSPGKRSGAYSEGAVYDVHSYQLLNFNGAYDDVSTLAHEDGHSMHYTLSNRHQPYATSEHATFVAEVASTLNENLLFRFMMARTKEDQARLFLLGERLESYRTTLFRQTLFAEFEMRIHEMGEAGEPLTGDSITKLYLDLLRKYYGHDLGVCGVEELYGIEWAYIPHFYSYDFYVYQYATSLTGSTAIAEIIRNEAAMTPPVSKTRDAYLGMLGAGCSKYPIDLLKDVGIDMTTSAPFDAAMREMNEIMDEMEAILGK